MMKNFDPFKEIKKSNDLDFLKKMLEFINTDIENWIKEKTPGKPYNEYVKKQLKGFDKLKNVTLKRIEELNKN